VNGSEILEVKSRYKESVQVKSEQKELLRFSLNKEWYGVAIEDVAEVVRCPEIFSVPHTPDHIAGVVNLRGEILTIVDVRKLLELPDAHPDDRKYLVVIDQRDIRVGILVDKASDLIGIPDSAIEPSLSASDSMANLVAGKVQLTEEVLAILNLDRLLEASEEQI
jgi:purine-binding chemotaxis protein CheW